MNKTLQTLLSFCVGLLLLTSCSSMRKVPYFQNADYVDLTDSKGLYDAKIMPKDMLSISVSTLNADASAPFNRGTVSASASGSSASTHSSTGEGYLVDNNGNIEFPLIGRIHVAGLTKTQCQDLIKSKILPYMSKTENPLVIVRMSSYHITILGEVKSPGVIPVATEKISVLEAIASAGDLTLYGKRDNVMLIREDASGQKSIYRLNLNDANIINSPYFYLRQNDVLYIQPNKVQASNAGFGPVSSMVFSFIGVATGLTGIVIGILRK